MKEHITPARYAIYARFSSDQQNEISLESQEMMCRREVAKRGGVVVGVYTDAAKFGWSLNRDGFIALRADAAKRAFDAVIMWKFDRLARDHSQVTMIKALFRHEYGVRLFCVEGYSEDDDSSPYTAMLEQLLAVFSDFYSKNLSVEIKRSVLHRYQQGQYKGSKPPFGYRLAVVKSSINPDCFAASDECPPGLYLNPRAAVLVRRLFRLYASGRWGYLSLSGWLRAAAHRHKVDGGRNFGAGMIREILQNRVYLGEVGHAELVYKKGFGRGAAGRRGRINWYPGVHPAIIDAALYDQCQQVRLRHMRNNAPDTSAIILLAGKVYCADCLVRRRSVAASYARMNVQNTTGRQTFACLSHMRGFERCGAKRVKVAALDQQVIGALMTLAGKLPSDVQTRIEQVSRARAENAAAVARMDDLAEMVKRIDFSWEQGWLSQDEYSAKRRQLQYEIEASRPVDVDEMQQAAGGLRDIVTRWAAADAGEKRAMLDAVIERVIVRDGALYALVLRGDVSLILDQ